MTQEDIIRMAREAGMHFSNFGWTTGDDPDCLYPECVYTKNLERFFQAAYAAGAAAAIKDAPDYKMGYADGVAVEREACAKVCDELRHESFAAETDDWIAGTHACADAIRARGQA